MENTINKQVQSQIEPPATGTSKVNVGRGERILSVVGGAILAALGLRKRKPGNIAMAAGGGYLLFRGLTGYCPVNDATGRNTAAKTKNYLEVKTSVLVNRPREEVYSYWRQLENLPVFMNHLKKVEQLDIVRSHWEAQFPGAAIPVTWNALIVADERGYRIAWRSQEGSMIDNAGEVRFMDAGRANKTEVQVTIHYRVPAGELGQSIGKLFNTTLERKIRKDIKRFKDLLEARKTPSVKAEEARAEATL